MTPTFTRNSAGQQGVTLFELIIALVLIGLMALTVASGLRASSPHMAVKAAAGQLVADLKRARIEAETGENIAILFHEDGYDIASISIARKLPHGVRAIIEGGDGGAILMGEGFRFRPYHIQLIKGAARAGVRIDPVTRRISIAQS